MREAPIEWWVLLLGIVGLDFYYHKTKKRSTLSNAIKTINKDPVFKSLSWALWTWLCYHIFFESN